MLNRKYRKATEVECSGARVALVAQVPLARDAAAAARSAEQILHEFERKFCALRESRPPRCCRCGAARTATLRVPLRRQTLLQRELPHFEL